MALKVRLPLNKDTRNVGLTNVNVINNGVTLTTGGIYGNCFLFNGKRNFLTFEKPVSLSPIGHSICCWLTLSYVTSRQYLLGFENGGIGYNGKTFEYVYGGIGIKWDYKRPVDEGDEEIFVHIAFVWNSGTVKLYVNSKLLKEEDVKIPEEDKCAFVGKIKDEYYYHGKMNDLRIYDHALTDADILSIYNNRGIFEIPYSQEAEKPEYPLWLKLLHHNAPASNMFTAANCKKNSNNNLYSRLGWLFGNTIFKLDNGKYEMLAKEKLESGSTENIFRWTQTSSPTASTITGFSAITNVSNSYLLGLKHNGSYAALHNGSTYWCACGSYTIYKGGNPGFNGVIKSGYLDLFVRAEIKHLPSKYEELQYITFNGTHYFYIDKPSGTHSSMKIEFGIEPDTLSHSQPTFFSGKDSGVQFYRTGTQNMGLWTSNGKMGFGGFISGQKNSLIVELTPSLVKSNLNGYITTSTSTNAFNKFFTQTCVCFTVGAYNVNSYGFFGKLYGLKIYIDESLYFLGIPAKRKSDNVIGMYDLVSKKFITNAGTGSFTGA